MRMIKEDDFQLSVKNDIDTNAQLIYIETLEYENKRLKEQLHCNESLAIEHEKEKLSQFFDLLPKLVSVIQNEYRFEDIEDLFQNVYKERDKNQQERTIHILELPITMLPISQEVMETLQSHNITIIKDLLRYTKYQIHINFDIGEMSINRIEHYLKEHSIPWRD